MSKEKKIKQIEKKIKGLEHDLINSYRTGLRYNTIQKGKIDQEKDFKKWSMYKNKIDFYSELIFQTEAKIKRLKVEKGNLEVAIEDKEYAEKLKVFDGLMATDFTRLLTNLDNILNSEPFDVGLANKIYSNYVERSKGIKKEHLWIYENFGMGTIKIRYSYILEWIATAARKDAKIQSGLKASKIDKFAGFILP